MVGKIEYRSFLGLLLLVTLTFIMLMVPFFTSIFWAIALAIVFTPLYNKFLRKISNQNLAALCTLLCIIFLVVIPIGWVAVLTVQEAIGFYNYLQGQAISAEQIFQDLQTTFPYTLQLLEKFNVDMVSLREHVTKAIITVSTLLANYVPTLGGSILGSLSTLALLLYLSFFMITDNKKLINYLHLALPLGDTREAVFFEKFATVTRATIKGSLAVAVAQGFLGGLIFAILGISNATLWGTLMVFLSLIPLVGSALVWLPVAIYFLVSGQVMSGVILIAFGVIVIGLVDNILRPILVGKDTKLPDYLVLLSTLGGFGLFGINGFVIGPLITTLFVTMWDMFIREFNCEEDAIIKNLIDTE